MTCLTLSQNAHWSCLVVEVMYMLLYMSHVIGLVKVHYIFHHTVLHILRELAKTVGSSGSARSIGLSLSLCADSHAWRRGCYTIPERYERSVNCQNLAIRRPDKHSIIVLFLIFRVLQFKTPCIDISQWGDSFDASTRPWYDKRPQVEFCIVLKYCWQTSC